VACGLKVVLCLDGVAATVDMFGAEHKDEKGTPISSLKKPNYHLPSKSGNSHNAYVEVYGSDEPSPKKSEEKSKNT
jgi:hypothetical protein